MTTLLDLAKVFSDLANDPSWSRRTEEADPRGTTEYKWCIHNKDDTFHVFRAEQEAREYADSPLNMARLALMVSEKQTIIWSYRDEMGKVGNYGSMDREQLMLDFSLNELDINPDHYAKVKEREKVK